MPDPPPNDRCPASGLTNAACQASVCDCFPDEPDRWGLHPERYVVAGVPAGGAETGPGATHTPPTYPNDPPTPPDAGEAP